MKLTIDNNEYNIIKANSFYKRLLGLMFKKNITNGMYFKYVNSIHTFFMKENIDIIGLNNKNEIIYKALNVQKNKIIIINNPIKNTSVLELPANTSKNLKIGDILTFKSK